MSVEQKKEEKLNLKDGEISEIDLRSIKDFLDTKKLTETDKSKKDVIKNIERNFQTPDKIEKVISSCKKYIDQEKNTDNLKSIQNFLQEIKKVSESGYTSIKDTDIISNPIYYQSLKQTYQKNIGSCVALIASIEQKINLPSNTSIPETKEISSEGKKALTDILSVDTITSSHSDLLFEGKGDKDAFVKGKKAFDVLFSLSKEGSLDFSQLSDDQTIEKKMATNFNSLLKSYLGGDITSYAIKISDGKDNYLKGKKYISVIHGGKTTDIMFGSDHSILHKARNDKFKEDIVKEDFVKNNCPVGDISTTIRNLDDRGGAYAFSELIAKNPQYLKNFLEKGAGFTALEGESDISDLDDFYHKMIVEEVVKQAEKGNMSYLQDYLKIVTPATLKYLGKDVDTQIDNFNIIGKYIYGGKFDKTTEVNKEILTTITLLRLQIAPKQKDLKDAVNEGASKFIDSFGKQIMAVLDMFGGKGAVKKFFESLGLKDFYEKNFKTIDDKLDALYKQEYELSKEDRDAVNSLVDLGEQDKPQKEIDAMDDEEKKTLKEKQQDRKESMLEGKQPEFIDASKLAEIQKSLGDNFTLLDPRVVNNVINNHNNNKDIKTDDKINLQDVLVKNSKGEFEFKNEVNEEIKKQIIKSLVSDPETWKNVVNAGYLMTKREFNTSSPGREKRLDTQRDILLFLGAYAYGGGKDLAYSVSETDWDKKNIDNIGTTPVKTDVVAPVKTDVVAPVKTDVVAPVKTDVVAPVKTDVVVPVKTDVVAPVKTDVVVPVKTDVVAPVKTDVVAPVKIDLKVESFDKIKMTQIIKNAIFEQVNPKKIAKLISNVSGKAESEIFLEALNKQISGGSDYEFSSLNSVDYPDFSSSFDGNSDGLKIYRIVAKTLSAAQLLLNEQTKDSSEKFIKLERKLSNGNSEYVWIGKKTTNPA